MFCPLMHVGYVFITCPWDLEGLPPLSKENSRSLIFLQKLRDAMESAQRSLIDSNQHLETKVLKIGKCFLTGSY